MGDLIRLLPDHVANQIAAGEVVQRPASAVKELLENSIDAGAIAVTLVLKDAGRTLIQVTDDGAGMSPADARLCFERHATSKIRAADDLQSLSTKGFRGEALASIAAIAHVELVTRPATDELGTRVLLEGGKLRSQETVAATPGTTITVRGLFYNVPARRQFLKSDSVELKHALEEFQRVALAHPEVGFTVFHNDQELFRVPAANEEMLAAAALRQRISHLFGRRYDERLVPVEEATDLVRVQGFVGKPEFARRARGEQYFFLNRRYIRSPYLEHAVRKAYEELLQRETYPAWYLAIEIDPARIDVNIHPTKTEVKFQDDRAVHAIVHAAVRRALGRFNISPSLDFEPEPAMIAAFSGGAAAPATWRPNDLGTRPGPAGWQQLFDLPTPPALPSVPALERPLAPQQDMGALTLPSREGDTDPGARPVIQLHGRYILAQLRTGFMVVDRARAVERIAYERALGQLERGGTGASQAELFPRTIELSTMHQVHMEEILPDLRALGFDLHPFGGRTWVINGVPVATADADPVVMLDELLERLRADADALRSERRAVIAKGVAAGLAAREQGELSTQRMHDLIDQLFACSMPYQSPAGKPTLVTYTLEELARRFER